MLTEYRKNLTTYLNLLDSINGNNIKVKGLNCAIDLGRNMNNLKREKKCN
jgi:hypothetical protein